jgi:hypothetical protein
VSDYNAGNVPQESDRYVRFIFVDVGTMFNIPAGFEDVAVSGLTVSTVDTTFQFLERSASNPNAFNTQGAVQKYMEREVLYGAVFSDSSEEFDCLIRRAYERLNVVARVYFEKFNEIAPMYEATYCEGSYRDSPEIGSLITATEVYPPDYAMIGAAKDGLGRRNKELQLKSCPLMY